MERVEQPLTKKQRKELQEIVAWTTQLLRAALFVGLFVFLGLLLRSLQNAAFIGPPLWLVVVAILAVWLYVRSGRWTGGRKWRRLVHQDLEAGVALATIVEPVSVVEVEDIEDVGVSFIIETSTGEVTLFAGQEMDRYKLKGFPWSKIKVIEAPRSKKLFGLERMGESIPVDRTTLPFSYDQAKRLGCFDQTFTILDAQKRRILTDT